MSGINGPLSDETATGAGAAVVGAGSLGFVGRCGLILLCTRKDRKEETKHTMNHYSDNRSVLIQVKNSVSVL
jgi:hypothetical protein